MTIWTKKLQIPKRMVFMIPIQVVYLKHQRLSIPLTNPTDFTLSLSFQNAIDVFTFKIRRFDLRIRLENLIVGSVGKTTLIVLPVSCFC